MGPIAVSGSQLSHRVSENLDRGRLIEVRSYCNRRPYDPINRPDGIVALAIAENKLMRDEITAHINDHFKIDPFHLTYGEGPAGAVELRSRIADFVNDSFGPRTTITAQHLCVSNGVASAVSDFSFCVGDPGDGILIGRPLYVGFFDDIEASAKLKAVLVSMGDCDPLSVDAVKMYEKALLEAEQSGTKIRAILISNPHNPLGRPYGVEALEEYLKLCSKYNIHLLSDEVYVKSCFKSEDFPNPPPFTSILSLDIQQHIDPALVHVMYGMSKDFCANGIRIGCFISPHNPAMLKAYKSISAFTWQSQLAEHVWLNLLSDKPFLDWYFPEMQKRLSESYSYVTHGLKRRGIPYNAASVTSFVWVDLSAYLEEDSEEAELALNWRMAEAGVWISMGASFGSEKHGYYRITFATPRDELELGLGRLFKVLDETKAQMQSKHGSSAV